MGDMADFALDCAMDDVEIYDNYLDGHFSPQEAYDMGITNEHGGVDEFPWHKNTKRVSCKYCKSTSVHWEKRADKWILFDNTTMLSHSCKEYFAKKGL